MKKIIRKVLRSVLWFIKARVLPTAIIGLVGIMIGAASFSSSTVTAVTQEVVKEVEVKGYAAVMDRIAQCESGGKQFGKHGQVIININTNGTYDQGKYQINSIHNGTATNLGYNLATEEGNEGFAYWMYENLGTRDWYSSEKCWRK